MVETVGSIAKENEKDQVQLRGEEAPGSMETYAKVHAELAFKKDLAIPENKKHFSIVLTQYGFTHSKWLEMERYWTPILSSDIYPEFNPQQAKQFEELLIKEFYKVSGIES